MQPHKAAVDTAAGRHALSATSQLAYFIFLVSCLKLHAGTLPSPAPAYRETKEGGNDVQKAQTLRDNSDMMLRRHKFYISPMRFTSQHVRCMVHALSGRMFALPKGFPQENKGRGPKTKQSLGAACVTALCRLSYVYTRADASNRVSKDQ